MIEKNKDINKAENTLYSRCNKKSSIFCEKKVFAVNGGIDSVECSFKSTKCELSSKVKGFDLTMKQEKSFLSGVNVNNEDERAQMAVTFRINGHENLRFNHINRCLPVQGLVGGQTDTPTISFRINSLLKESSNGR
jgi:hypothetical protein